MWAVALTLCACASLVRAHGRVVQPASRASAWRRGFPTPPDYDDDGVNCGGLYYQWAVNGGKCGICGDAYDKQQPRPHELGGVYGTGLIVERYLAGSTISVIVDLTTSHRGSWQFKLCPDPHNNHQECFDKYTLELEAGGDVYYPKKGSIKYMLNYKLPAGLVCEHCVLQWRYTAGNNWGTCKNGTQGLGCGNQEQFGACSDISIKPSGNSIENEIPEEYSKLPSPLLYYLKHGYFESQSAPSQPTRADSMRPRKPSNRLNSKFTRRRKKDKKKPHRRKKTALIIRKYKIL